MPLLESLNLRRRELFVVAVGVYTRVVSVDSFTRVTGSVSDLLGTVLWPAVALIIVTRLLPEIRRVLERGGVNVRAPGLEVSIERASEAAAALGAASRAKGETAASPRDVAATISSVSKRQATASRGQARVLWVDDHPENNEYERQAMSALGILIDLAKSTTEALELLRKRSYDLIISDLGRKSSAEDDPNAGLTLLDRVRAERISLPYIIYAGSRAITERDRILAAGATDSINSPTELVDAIVNALGR